MTVHLYLTDIRPLSGRENALLPLLTEERRRQAVSFRHPAGRLHCIATGLLLRHVLGAEDGDIARNAHGKPCLPHCDDLHFNLSHGGDYAVLAVSPQEVGVDIEPVPQTVNTALTKKVFHPDERQWLMDDPTPERFALLWTRLESALKAAGTGFDDANRPYSLVDGTCPYHVQTLTHDRHIVTVAVENDFAIETHILSLEDLLS